MAGKKEIPERDKYYLIRTNDLGLYHDAYINRVYINENDKTITIKVDASFEYYTNDDWLPEEDDSQVEPIDNTDGGFRISDQEIYDNNNDYIIRDAFHLSHQYPNEIHKYKTNPIAGLMVTFPVGEGLIEFCFTDFSDELKDLKIMGAFLKAVRKKTTDEEDIGEFTHQQRFDMMDDTFFHSNKILEKSMYTLMFPPMLSKVDDKSTAFYTFCITELQKEMLRRIEFVFDEEYYPKELLHLTAHERYGLYAEIYDIPRSFRRTEEFEITYRLDRTTLDSCRLPMDIILSRLQSHSGTKEKSPLEKALGLEAGKVNLAYSIPKFMSVSYEVCALHDMLELEFTKMLEYGVRLHKCKNCGRYFIVKGNYNAEYCDRVREGNSQTCQQIAAQKKYEEKLHTDKAVSLFRKYYKRYHARLKVGTIKPDHFRLWNYQACEKRDMCQNGEISLEEFEDWLEGSFKNRKK